MGEHPESDRQDAAAVAAVLAGDRYAYRTIVDKYESVLFSLSMSYLRNRDDAMDACQDIFLRAYRALPTFASERRFLPWLYTIAINYLKTYRKRRPPVAPAVDTTGYDQPADTRRPGPDGVVIRDQKLDCVRRAVSRLPDRIRDAVVLYYLEELSVEETAEVLGVSIENVKSRLFRARKKLKELIERENNDGCNQY